MRFQEKAALVFFVDDPKRGYIVEHIGFFFDDHALGCDGAVECFWRLAAVKECDRSQKHKGDGHDGAVLDERIDNDGEKHAKKREQHARVDRRRVEFRCRPGDLRGIASHMLLKILFNVCSIACFTSRFFLDSLERSKCVTCFWRCGLFLVG